jgi:hypothetical protein
VVISTEGLSTALLGAYGSAIAVTPAIDGLAAHGIVLDQCFADALSATEMLRSTWSCRHALQEVQSEGPSIWKQLEACGQAGLLVTDCQEAAELAEQMGCPSVVCLHLPTAQSPAGKNSECVAISFFSEAAAIVDEWLEQSQAEHRLIWIHSRMLKGPWDAPLDLRRRFADAQDPDPPSEVGPPEFPVTPSTDPDLVVGWGQVACAQVSIIDEAIETLFDWMRHRLESCACCLVGLGGVPLGEHGWVGWGRSQLYQEELQVAAIFVPNPALPIGFRRSELCQLPDLGASIAEWCGLNWTEGIWGQGIWGQSQLGLQTDSPPGQWPSSNQIAVAAHAGKVWVRVPAWSLAHDDNSDSLFVMPDDRWQVSDVSSRCPDVVNQLRELGTQFLRACQVGDRHSLPNLDDQLCNLLR